MDKMGIAFKSVHLLPISREHEELVIFFFGGGQTKNNNLWLQETKFYWPHRVTTLSLVTKEPLKSMQLTE